MFRDIGGVAVHTVHHGRGDQIVVGLTGVFGTTDIWQSPFELVSGRCRTLAYDHHGTGLTHVPDELVTFDAHVALVLDVLDEFGIDRCVLAGDSHVCATAMEAARRWPDRFDGLVLVAPALDLAPTDLDRRFVRGLREAFEATLDVFVPMCLPEDTDGHLQRWLRDIICRTGGERAAALVEAYWDVDVRDIAPRVSVPTLVVHGDDDRIPGRDVASVQELVRLLPEGRLLLLEGVGHVPTLSAPHQVVEAIGAMLDADLTTRQM